MKHGLARHPLYEMWKQMMRRCYGKHPMSRYYKDKGITVCKRWHDVRLFVKDNESKCPKGFSIERIDVSKGYTPKNVSFIPKGKQQRNRSTVIWGYCMGIKCLAIDAAGMLGGNKNLVTRRIEIGWSKDKAFNTRARPKRV